MSEQPGRRDRSGGGALAHLVGDDTVAPCLDGTERRYLSLDTAASTGALQAVADAVAAFLPSYSSVHRGAGFKSQASTEAFESARRAVLEFAGRGGGTPPGRDGGGHGVGDGAARRPPAAGHDVAIFCRNTTEALNHLAYRLRLSREDVVVTTVVEHHANLLPWSRLASCRYVECGPDGTFTPAAVVAALELRPAPRLLTITGASNITGWMPALDEIIPAAHDRNIPVVVDAAQLAPHRPLPPEADFVAWSGHKMYAPFGSGVLVGPRSAFEEGDPFLAGGGAVDLVDLNEVVWTAPPEREEAGSPNVVGAVALAAAVHELSAIGWDAIAAHDRRLAALLRSELAKLPGVRLLGPRLADPELPVATFVVEGVPHSLVAARLAAEAAVGVRHGCFCAHPYLLRLLGLSTAEVGAFREQVLRGDRRQMPGAVRASLGLDGTEDDVGRLVDGLGRILREPAPVTYEQDRLTGDWFPATSTPFWLSRPGEAAEGETAGRACSPG